MMMKTYSAHTTKSIKHWLAIRNSLLTEYCQVSGTIPFEPTLYAKNTIIFCQLLVDYTATWQFSILNKILAQIPAAVRLKKSRYIQRLYQDIAATTDAILDYNERNQKPMSYQQARSEKKHLSRIGEIIAERMDLEDKLLSLADMTMLTEEFQRSRIA